MFEVAPPSIEKLTRRKEFRMREADAERIKAAAAAIGLQEADFIRQAALRQASDIERRVGMTILLEPAFDAFHAALDAPARSVPGLADAARRTDDILSRDA